jgi:hypothetical protein
MEENIKYAHYLTWIIIGRAFLYLLLINIGFILILAVISLQIAILSLYPLWSAFIQLQLFMILFLTDSAKSKRVSDYFCGINDFIISFKFMKISSLWWLKDLTKYYHIPQESDELKTIGLDSTSSYENLLDFMILLFIIILIDILITLIAKLLQLNFNRARLRFIRIVNARYAKVMRYSFYIRVFLMVYQFAILTSVSEIHESNLGSTSEVTSLTFALLILMFCLAFTLYSLVLIMSGSTLQDKHQPFQELYLGNSN